MDSIFKGDVGTAQGRVLAWIDSLFVDHAVLRLAHSNFGTVIAGKLYRCNHPTPMLIRRLTRRVGLTTVINLRGATGTGSYHLSRDAALETGLAYHDLSMESRGAPHRDRILRLLEIYRALPGPALLHCKSGADRAGLAAGLCLLFEGRSAQRCAAATLLALRAYQTGANRHPRCVLPALSARGRGPQTVPRLAGQDYDEAALRRDFHANGLASFINDWVLVHE